MTDHRNADAGIIVRRLGTIELPSVAARRKGETPMTNADQIAAMAREPRSPERDERLVHLLLGVRTIGGALVCPDESLLDPKVRDAIREQLLATPNYAPPAVRGAPARVVAPAFELDAPVSVEVDA